MNGVNEITRNSSIYTQVEFVISTLGTTHYKSVGGENGFFLVEHGGVGGLERSKGTFIYHILELCLKEGS